MYKKCEELKLGRGKGTHLINLLLLKHQQRTLFMLSDYKHHMKISFQKKKHEICNKQQAKQKEANLLFVSLKCE